MIREPAVAGKFYPGNSQELLRALDRALAPPTHAVHPPAIHALGCIAPHAGYMYSGAVAGAVLSRIQLPRRFIILGPRHYPRGAPLAILSRGAWRTPLGDAPIDEPLADALARACPLLREDEVAHAPEHAIEVELPFLQKLVSGFRFVPIALGTDRFQAFEDLGRAIASVLAAESEPVLILASSDMNHYESDEITRQKDALAIGRILALDPRGLYDVVRREQISMCGYGPAATMLVAANQLGASRAELVRYATSAEVSGDTAWCVGYAGILVV